MRTHLSAHVCNDDMRLYRFERTSGLPRGYFDRPRLSPDAWVFIVCMVAALIVWVLA